MVMFSDLYTLLTSHLNKWNTRLLAPKDWVLVIIIEYITETTLLENSNIVNIHKKLSRNKVCHYL